MLARLVLGGVGILPAIYIVKTSELLEPITHYIYNHVHGWSTSQSWTKTAHKIFEITVYIHGCNYICIALNFNSHQHTSFILGHWMVTIGFYMRNLKRTGCKWDGQQTGDRCLWQHFHTKFWTRWWFKLEARLCKNIKMIQNTTETRNTT